MFDALVTISLIFLLLFTPFFLIGLLIALLRGLFRFGRNACRGQSRV
ncbi:MAG: hypothetical protein ACYC26_06635 [Phycisphaerales bacterium]